MNSVCESCVDGKLCSCSFPKCQQVVDRFFPRPFSLITLSLVLVELVLSIGIIVSLIIEATSDSFSCPSKIIIHPLIMLSINLVNCLIFFLLYRYFNRDFEEKERRPNSDFYMKRTSQLLCYRPLFCLFYIWVIGFVVFVVVGQLFLLEQPETCLRSIRATIVFDFISMAAFFSLIIFGGFLLCLGINHNSRDGCGPADCCRFTINILSCGILFKSHFSEDRGTQRGPSKEGIKSSKKGFSDKFSEVWNN